MTDLQGFILRVFEVYPQAKITYRRPTVKDGEFRWYRGSDAEQFSIRDKVYIIIPATTVENFEKIFPKLPEGASAMHYSVDNILVTCADSAGEFSIIEEALEGCSEHALDRKPLNLWVCWIPWEAKEPL